MVSFDISTALEWLRDRPAEVGFLPGGWLVHRPTKTRFQLDPDGHLAMESKGEFHWLDIDEEQAGQFCSLFRSWYDDYWRPKQIERLIDSYKAPQNVFQHVLRRIGLRRNLRLPPTSGEVLGLSTGLFPRVRQTVRRSAFAPQSDRPLSAAKTMASFRRHLG